MKYRHEKRASDNAPQTGWKGVLLWLVGFPGYIIFLASWLVVASGIIIEIAGWLIPPTTPSASRHAASSGGHGLVIGPFFVAVAGILIACGLALVYWLLVNYTVRAIEKLADFLDTSIWVIKFIGVPLGCELAGIATMLYRPTIGLTALWIATGLGLIGLCSFSLEYSLHTIPENKQ